MLKSQLGASILDNKFREMDYERHVRNVTDIVYQNKSKFNQQSAEEIKEAYLNAKSGNIKFNENVKQYEINQQNQAILCKLIEISQGKQSFLNAPEYQSMLKKEIQPNQKILHLPFRQEKLKHIDEENKALAKRIYGQKSFINRGKLLKDIDQYEKLKKHMQKFKSTSVIQSKNIKLPPLFEPKVEETTQESTKRFKLNLDKSVSKQMGEKTKVGFSSTQKEQKQEAKEHSNQEKKEGDSHLNNNQQNNGNEGTAQHKDSEQQKESGEKEKQEEQSKVNNEKEKENNEQLKDDTKQNQE